MIFASAGAVCPVCVTAGVASKITTGHFFIQFGEKNNFLLNLLFFFLRLKSDINDSVCRFKPKDVALSQKPCFCRMDSIFLLIRQGNNKL